MKLKGTDIKKVKTFLTAVPSTMLEPVGATSVHLVCGIWGTIAVALFGNFEEAGIGELSDQLIGIFACGAFTFSLAFLLFFILKVTIGIRVTAEEEEKGLDIEEHKISAYT